MNTQGFRRPIRGYMRDTPRRKRVLAFDLNDTPSASEHGVGRPALPAAAAAPEAPVAAAAASAPAAIDVEAIDDEVVISSPRSFAEARNKSRRNHGVTVLLDEDSDVHQGLSEEPITRLTLNGYKKRKRSPPNQTIINCECYINLEGGDFPKRVTKPRSVAPPKEPTFSCPVCMGQLVEETSTKCGHIFCKKCIKAAITAQSKCPTCRRKLTMKDTIRVYLPASTTC